MFTGTEKVLRILLGEKRSLQNSIYSWIQFLQESIRIQTDRDSARSYTTNLAEAVSM